MVEDTTPIDLEPHYVFIVTYKHTLKDSPMGSSEVTVETKKWVVAQYLETSAPSPKYL